MTRHYHLIGICGIGMSGIANLFMRRGIRVSGSDLKESRISERLREQGAKVFIGHNAANIQGADLVIYSSAIKKDNPEILAAERQGIRSIKRAEALARLMEDEVVITAAGSHGKTTTASLISCLLLEAGLCPTIAVGGILRNIDTNACLGGGKFFVAEADESDGSFLCYHPKYSIITNIDYEHLDYYNAFEGVIGAFGQFIAHTKEDGCVFACYDDINLRTICKGYGKRYVFFGLKEGACIYPKNIELKELTAQFDCFYDNKFIDRFNISLGGTHNISNALSVIAVGLELKIDIEIIKRTLFHYKGTHRRLEIKFRDKEYLVIDDYAHHPTEIMATLEAVRNFRFNRLIAVFQPHRYTRTKLLLDEFGRSFRSADYIIVTDVYPAGEEPLDGINGNAVYDKIKGYAGNKQIRLLPKEEVTAHILEIIKPGDLVLTLGAGDIVKVSDSLARKLKDRYEAALYNGA